MFVTVVEGQRRYFVNRSKSWKKRFLLSSMNGRYSLQNRYLAILFNWIFAKICCYLLCTHDLEMCQRPHSLIPSQLRSTNTKDATNERLESSQSNLILIILLQSLLVLKFGIQCQQCFFKMDPTIALSSQLSISRLIYIFFIFLII